MGTGKRTFLRIEEFEKLLYFLKRKERAVGRLGGSVSRVRLWISAQVSTPGFGDQVPHQALRWVWRQLETHRIERP